MNPPDTVVGEKFFRTSDDVELKIFDFTPKGCKTGDSILVFVAGWISQISGWKDVLKELTPVYRTLYIETREKISARLPDRKGLDFSIERMALDIDEILQKEIAKDQIFYFAGSSMGATAIMDYLALGKKQPKESYLISPVCKFNIPKWALALVKVSHPSFYSAIKPVAKWYLRNFRLDRQKEPEQVAKYEGTIDAAEPKRLKATTLAVSRYSLWEKLPRLKSPVCIIGAHSDTLHGVDKLRQMTAKIPSATLKLMQSNKETHSERAGIFIREQMR